MSKRRWLRTAAVWSLMLAVLGGLLSCATAVESGPRAWIDFPRDGASGPPGTPVPVVCHASAPKGVVEVSLSVNGAEYRRSPVVEAGATFGKVTFEWLPGEAGVYTLQARAYDKAGAASSPNTITVRIGGTPVPQFTRTPTPVTPAHGTATPTRPPTATPTQPPTATPTRPPTVTPTWTRVPTATPTVFPPAVAKFVTDRKTLVAGECALLQWWVQNATAVFLNGEGVAGEGTRSVCPATTTTYTLRVEAPSGNIDERITITVSAPPDTTPPPVPSLQVPAEGLVLACRATQTLAWLPVSDASGIAGYDVRLERQTTPGNWQAAQAWDQVADKQVTANVECGRYYRWRVRAKDGAGNYSAWSAWRQFSVALS